MNKIIGILMSCVCYSGLQASNDQAVLQQQKQNQKALSALIVAGAPTSEQDDEGFDDLGPVRTETSKEEVQKLFNRCSKKGSSRFDN